MMLSRPDREWIETRARQSGFALAGVAAVPHPDSDRGQVTDQRFAAWIDAGYSGEMEWLQRRDAEGKLVRGDLRRALPWARSVVVCAVNYNTRAPQSTDPAEPNRGWIARYAWSGEGAEVHHASSGEPGQEATQAADYHDLLLPKLQGLEAELHERFGPELQTRSYVDTGPVVERGFAELAGVGWIGKNTCVLNQEQGSWLLLGVVITSLALETEAWAVPAADRCGTCTRCLDACPTGALIAPRQMDASRCIAYLTIEKKGSIPQGLREGMGRQVFGCDICQDVCPWNDHAPVSAQHPWPVRTELVNPPLEWLASMDGATFNRWFRGSPLERTRRKRLLRNVAIAMGNSREPRYRSQLRVWSQEDDPVLAEAAQWSLQQLEATAPPDAIAGQE